MKHIRKWIKSVLPPENKNVGWIDMSNAANPVKKVWENGGYTTVTEENPSSGTSNAAAAFTVAHSPIGVAKISVESNSNSGEEGIIGPEGSEEESYTYTIDEFIDIDTFVSDMGEFWPAYITWESECIAIWELELSTGESQNYPDAPAVVSKYVDTTNMQNSELYFVYETPPERYDFSSVYLNVGNSTGSLCYFGQDLTSVQVETNKYILCIPSPIPDDSGK